mmetsp:Transcript_151803/g.485192  ORF Transcript_151803/g.485192 Transcript_151803/m.485192 type:complete len:251 (+) Transcript_151803:87-839(+)
MNNNAVISMYRGGCDGLGTCTAAVVDNRPLEAFFHSSPPSPVVDGPAHEDLPKRSGGIRIKNKNLLLNRATGFMSIEGNSNSTLSVEASNNNSTSCINGSAAADKAVEVVRMFEGVHMYVEITSDLLDILLVEKDSDSPTESDSQTLGSESCGDDSDLATRLPALAPPPIKSGLGGCPAERGSGRVKIKNRNLNGHKAASDPASAVPTGGSPFQSPRATLVARLEEESEVFRCMPDASSLPLPTFVKRSI